MHKHWLTEFAQLCDQLGIRDTEMDNELAKLFQELECPICFEKLYYTGPDTLVNCPNCNALIDLEDLE